MHHSAATRDASVQQTTGQKFVVSMPEMTFNMYTAKIVSYVLLRVHGYHTYPYKKKTPSWILLCCGYGVVLGA